MSFLDVESRATKELAPGVQARTFWQDNMLVAIVDLDPHSEVPAYQHPHEQAGSVLSGELSLTIDGDDTRMLTQGDAYLIPGNVEHSATTGEVPARVIDVFSPVRDEYKY